MKGNALAKTPRDLARQMKERAQPETIIETFNASHTEAKSRAQWIFEKYPSSWLLTEIVSSKRVSSQQVEMTMRRLKFPVDTDE